MPVVDPVTMQSTHPRVFFGGDAAFGPKNIIWAVAHGHEAAISIDQLLPRRGRARAAAAAWSTSSARRWASTNGRTTTTCRSTAATACRRSTKPGRWPTSRLEVELGYRRHSSPANEAQRCLNCDVETVFADELCIECDACVDICPMDCITFTDNGPEPELRRRLTAPALNLTQDLYVSPTAEDRPGDGQGRGRLPALRAVCRALPDRGLGHAEILPRDGAGGVRACRSR